MTPTESRGPLAPKLPPREPPPYLEDRVVATLASRGLLAPASRNSRALGGVWRGAGALAAGVLLFFAGVLAQRAGLNRAAPRADATPRYALLLYGGRAESDDAEAARVNEYREWARGIAARGRFVTGEKLRDEARVLTSGGAVDRSASDPESLAGFFIVGAATASEAEAIARSCPHLRHGGRVVLRPIEPT